MRALALTSMLLALGCSPLSLEGNRFGPAVFLAFGAVSTVADTGLTIVAQEDAFGCDEAPTATPGRKTLVLQVAEPTVGQHQVADDAASGYLQQDACALGGDVVEAEGGVIGVDAIDATTAAGRFELTVEGEPAVGSFNVEICPDGLPIPERDCPDGSGLPPPQP